MLLVRLEASGGQCFNTLLDLADTKKLARRAAPAIHNALSEIVNAVFEAEGIPEWEPLSEYTLLQRAMLGFGPGPIMQRTGLLLESMTGLGKPAHIWITDYQARVSTFTFGSSLLKAGLLGRGDPEHFLPARPMFPDARIVHPELEGAIINAGRAI